MAAMITSPGSIRFFQNPLLILCAKLAPLRLAGTFGSAELVPKQIATLASLTMILLAALLCNYGRGFCLIDVGTEGCAVTL